MSTATAEAKSKSKKKPKTWEQLNAQGRFSQPDLILWYGWSRRTWSRKWSRLVPPARFIMEGHKVWAREQLAEFEAKYLVATILQTGTH
jgi:hypothetical protein